MPGHAVAGSTFKNVALFDKYQCPHCSRLLKKAVQLVCGHWLCESCADELLSSSSPVCQWLDCGQNLIGPDGEKYFPDLSVRREIKGMILYCPHRHKGCKWEDRLDKLEAHLETCDFTSEKCPQCCTILTPEQVESHKLACPRKYLFKSFRCTNSIPVTGDLIGEVQPPELETQGNSDMTRQGRNPVFSSDGKKANYTADCEALQGLALRKDSAKLKRRNEQDVIEVARKDKKLETEKKRFNKLSSLLNPRESQYPGMCTLQDCRNERDCASTIKVKAKGSLGNQDNVQVRESLRVVTDDGLGSSTVSSFGGPQTGIYDLKDLTKKLKPEMDERLTAELRRKDEEIDALINTITKLEKSMRSKHAEFEDRDFRLSLIENSNYDGTIIWKIPQFSQRMSDAQTGKYTSIFSLPFYTGRYGYKMCLRLYILGDGIGKNSHMSLFFVIMKGEFDNILQWPFTHKVTFKLINQTGGRDIIDTFQPDPMSSSFRRPKSDMNIASGCPRFVSHTELKTGGFIVDDTVFIKCSVDTSTIRHP